MARPKGIVPRVRRGTPPKEKAQWQKTYQRTPYDQLPWFEPGPSASLRIAAEEGFLPSKGTVLDIGCGAGSNLLFLAERGLHVRGIDLSPGAVAAARARAEERHLIVDVREGDALALDLPDQSLDAVNDNGCFHTIPVSRRGRYASEVFRVLRPEGRFVLSWVAREHVCEWGPPHRPSLAEVTTIFEPRFLFARTGFRPETPPDYPAAYFAFLVRRSSLQPPRR
jgi:SAM-dependent methyltransferase